MTPKLKFTEGEKVLCFHGPLLYEAKCIKSQVKDKQVKYFIHYSGWNKNWDEWVPESRVLKFNDGNLQKQKELEKAHVKTKKAKTVKFNVKKEPAEKERTPTPSQEKVKLRSGAAAAATTTATAATTPPAPATESAADSQRKKRTRIEQNVETEEEYVQKIEIKVRILYELKIWLVDDWSNVTRLKKLVRLPAHHTVDHIIDEYIKHKFAEKGITNNKKSAINEVTEGIREYFNSMLGKQLLYKFERPQYQEVLSKYPDKPMSEIYGAIHLLRLFLRIGSVLVYTPLDDDTIALLMNYFQDFVKFLSGSSHSFFRFTEYEVASEEYNRKVG